MSSEPLSGNRAGWRRITDVFSLRHLIGTMPKAGPFQMSFCLRNYNVL